VQALLDKSPAAVLHLWEPGCCAQLDQALQLLAMEFRGTRIARAPARSCTPLLRRLQRPQGAWVVAARGGTVAGIAAAGSDADQLQGITQLSAQRAFGGHVQAPQMAQFNGSASALRRRPGSGWRGDADSGDESSDFSDSDGTSWVRC
jgi:hypothetical protein